MKLALLTGSRIVQWHWKSREKVSFKDCRDELARTASDQIIHRVNNSLNVFRKAWGLDLDTITGEDRYDNSNPCVMSLMYACHYVIKSYV